MKNSREHSVALDASLEYDKKRSKIFEEHKLSTNSLSKSKTFNRMSSQISDNNSFYAPYN